MSKINITNVVVLDNPSPFLNPLQFEITFECLEELNEDLEWKIIYVGCANSPDYDQVLDSVLVGPVPVGQHMFVFQADPPDTARVPRDEVVGVTAILLTCSYRNQEFVRVGYFVNNEYIDLELRENPPASPAFDKLHRNILAEQPKVTRFKIDWDGSGDPIAREHAALESENIPPTNGGTESNQMECAESPLPTAISDEIKKQMGVVNESSNSMPVDMVPTNITNQENNIVMDR